MSDSSSSPTTGGQSASEDGHPSAPAGSVHHRPAWIAFVVLGAIFCLFMGFWQLTRYQAASGTVQNLGYTFMWPFLAGFLVYAYWKYVSLEADEADDAEAQESRPVSGTRPAVNHRESATPVRGTRPRRSRPATEIPADLLPTRRPVMESASSDEGLAAYNTYLADLARDETDNRSQESSAP